MRSPALALRCVSNPCDSPSGLLHFEWLALVEGFPRTASVPEGKISGSAEIQADWKPDPQAAALTLYREILSRGPPSVSPRGHHSQGIQRCPLGGGCENLGTRSRYISPPGAPGACSGAPQGGSVKTEPTGWDEAEAEAEAEAEVQTEPPARRRRGRKMAPAEKPAKTAPAGWSQAEGEQQWHSWGETGKKKKSSVSKQAHQQKATPACRARQRERVKMVPPPPRCAPS
ncbi:uncharacterized protein LOC116665088 [Camelus ferus]|uniref:Uncharacterized protein LOC116665088 n=1 Tax=Camelus ferus TaxID=419612 RepID=A0A8B8TEP3_CAMFR|nr:uncharacterized protein LOC116665088 [Camelus ferus]